MTRGLCDSNATYLTLPCNVPSIVHPLLRRATFQTITVRVYGRECWIHLHLSILDT